MAAPQAPTQHHIAIFHRYPMLLTTLAYALQAEPDLGVVAASATEDDDMQLARVLYPELGLRYLWKDLPAGLACIRALRPPSLPGLADICRNMMASPTLSMQYGLPLEGVQVLRPDPRPI